MRNRFLIVILSLMLVFSNIISVLAISFSSSAQSNNADMYVAKTYYFCNKST